MQLGMDVSIQQTQKLALTPQMEQSLSVLQMGSEELNQCIEEEVLSNPMLDYAKEPEKKRFAVRGGRDRLLQQKKDGRYRLSVVSQCDSG